MMPILYCTCSKNCTINTNQSQTVSSHRNTTPNASKCGMKSCHAWKTCWICEVFWRYRPHVVKSSNTCPNITSDSFTHEFQVGSDMECVDLTNYWWSLPARLI